MEGRSDESGDHGFFVCLVVDDDKNYIFQSVLYDVMRFDKSIQLNVF